MILAGLALACWTGWTLTSKWPQWDTISAVIGWLGVIVGLFFFWAGLYNRRMSTSYPRYCELILTQRIRSTDRLAQLMGITPETARRDVKTMISQKVLLGAQLSKDGEITEESDVQAPPSQTHPGADLLCPGCGAMNESDKEQCVFCGRTLRR